MPKKRKTLLTIGSYCFATKYGDRDPHDPWCIGFVKEIRIDNRGTWYILSDGEGNILGRANGFKHCMEITPEQGTLIISVGREINGYAYENMDALYECYKQGFFKVAR